MKKPIKEVKASKELTRFIEATMNLAPDEGSEFYSVRVGGQLINFDSEALNDLKIIILGGLEIPGEPPAERFTRKYKALKIKIKHLSIEYYRTGKISGTAEEARDRLIILLAAQKDKLNEDTFRLTRKYFEIPTINEL